MRREPCPALNWEMEAGRDPIGQGQGGKGGPRHTWKGRPVPKQMLPSHLETQPLALPLSFSELGAAGSRDLV